MNDTRVRNISALFTTFAQGINESIETGYRETIFFCNICDADKRKLHTSLIDTFKYIINIGEGVGKCQKNDFKNGKKCFTVADLRSSVCSLYQNTRMIVDLMPVYKYLHGKKI